MFIPTYDQSVPSVNCHVEQRGFLAASIFVIFAVEESYLAPTVERVLLVNMLKEKTTLNHCNCAICSARPTIFNVRWIDQVQVGLDMEGSNGRCVFQWEHASFHLRDVVRAFGACLCDTHIQNLYCNHLLQYYFKCCARWLVLLLRRGTVFCFHSLDLCFLLKPSSAWLNRIRQKSRKHVEDQLERLWFVTTLQWTTRSAMRLCAGIEDPNLNASSPESLQCMERELY